MNQLARNNSTVFPGWHITERDINKFIFIKPSQMNIEGKGKKGLGFQTFSTGL